MALQPASTGEVQGILTHDYDGVTALDPFIKIAYNLTKRVRQCAIDNEEPLTVDELKALQPWIAAHLYKYTADRQFQQRSVQGVTVGGGFTGQTAMYFEGTTYGQTALNLDVSGCLIAIIKRQTAKFDWLGKPHSEQVPYWDRD